MVDELDEAWLDNEEGDFLIKLFVGRCWRCRERFVLVSELAPLMRMQPLILAFGVLEAVVLVAVNEDEQTDTFVVSLWMLQRLVDLPAASKLLWLACLEAAADEEGDGRCWLSRVVELTAGRLSKPLLPLPLPLSLVEVTLLFGPSILLFACYIFF